MTPKPTNPVDAADAFLWERYMHLLRVRGAREDEIRAATCGAKSFAEFQRHLEDRP